MKQCRFWPLVLLITLLAVPSVSQSQEAQPGGSAKDGQTGDKPSWFAVGIRSNYFRLGDSRRTIVGNLTALLEEDQNYIPMPVIQASLSKYVAFELSMSQFKAMALNNDYSKWSSDGDLNWTSYMLGVQFRWPHFPIPLVPYLSGGVSLNKTSWDKKNWYYYGFPDPAVYADWTAQGNKPEDFPNNGYRRIHKVDDAYGVYLGFGADYFITKHWAVNLDWRYQWSTANWDYQLVNNDGLLRDTPGTVVLDSWTIGLGVKYFF
jgi:hypothetical protein